MTAETIIAALALPPNARVEQRVPKKLLMEQGAPTAADKRVIQDGIEELFWVAALKPTNIGVPGYQDEVREYLEIAVLTTTFRQGAKGGRLVELVHRAVPYPVVLVGTAVDGCTFSVAHKRWSQGEAGKVVLDEGYPQMTQISSEGSTEAGFLDSLAVSNLSRGNLFALYQGWIDRVAALEAARITGVYAVPGAIGESGAVRDGLDAHKAIERELVGLRARAKKEKQFNRRVELNLEIKRLEGKMAVIAGQLGGNGS